LPATQLFAEWLLSFIHSRRRAINTPAAEIAPSRGTNRRTPSFVRSAIMGSSDGAS
jgi:hypothetical protein